MNLLENNAYSQGTVEHSLEIMRQEVQKIKKFLFGLIATGLIFVNVLTMFPNLLRNYHISMIRFVIMAVVVLCIVFVTINYNTKLQRYRALYKEQLVVQVLNEQFTNVFYNYKQGFTESDIKEKAFVRMGNKFHSEDYLRAEYNGVKFARADVRIENETKDNKNNCRYVTYFEGRVYELEFNKKISAGMQICSQNFMYGVLPKYLNKKDKVQTENMNFNNAFEIHANYDAEAFYVLTPHMMEHIMELSRRFTSLCMNIVGNKMVLAVNSSLDALEPPTNTPINYQAEKNRILAELTEIIAIIDELNLADRTFADSGYDELNSHIPQEDEKTLEDMFLGNIG